MRKNSAMLPGVKVLVTGGAGFIGSHISDALLARGHEVAIFDNFSTGHRRNVPEGTRLIEGDLRDRKSVMAAVADFAPEIICHQGAQTSVAISAREPVMDAEVNVLGSLHLLDAAVKHGVRRIIFASTGGAIYGEVAEGTRATTEWEPRPQSPYACAKFSTEKYLDAYAHAHGLDYRVLRYANVYGPRQDPHGEAGVVAIFAQRLIAGRSIQINAMKDVGDRGCVRDYVYVDDVVEANLQAIETDALAKVVNVATGVPTATQDIADALCDALGVKSEFGFGPMRPGDLERSVLEPGALPATGTPTGLAEGIRRTAAWFAEAAKG